LAAEVKKKLNWDELTCEEAGLECIDEEKFGWFLKEGIKQRGLNLSEDSPLEEALVRLKLLRKGNLTNAALLLFSKEQIFLQSEVKCIRFSGNEPVKPYIDFQTIEQNVFDLINLAEDFILRNIRKSIWLIPDKVQREEKYEYPPDGLHPYQRTVS
jgi:ATP-dependent DNA helicase RecG